MAQLLSTGGAEHGGPDADNVAVAVLFPVLRGGGAGMVSWLVTRSSTTI